MLKHKDTTDTSGLVFPATRPPVIQIQTAARNEETGGVEDELNLPKWMLRKRLRKSSTVESECLSSVDNDGCSMQDERGRYSPKDIND